MVGSKMTPHSWVKVNVFGSRVDAVDPIFSLQL
jgi:hypothetical protein